MSNKKNGSDFEKELCRKLAENGIWARLEYPAEDGSQPFDVKAIYRNQIYIFECKDCKNGYFSFNRIEDNQEVALRFLANNLLDQKIMFAFNFNNDWLFVNFKDVFWLKRWVNKTRIKKEDLIKYSMDFEELVDWIKRNGDW